MRDNLYFLYGEEDYLIGERIKQIAAGLGEGVAIETLGAKEVAGQLGELVNAQSLFSENRLLIINDRKIFNDKEFADKIPQLLSANASTETVVFVYPGMPDGRKKLTAWLKKEGQAEEFRSFAPWQEEEALAFIIREAGRNKKKIGSHAAALFWELAGANLRHLSKEIEKAATYIGVKDKIEREDVLAVISAGEVDVFSFVESLKNKQTKKALQTLNRLLKEKEDPIRVLGLLASQFRLLLKVKALKEMGRDLYKMSSDLKTKPFFIRKTLEKVGKFSIAELKNILALLLDADYKLKTGQASQLVLESLVLEICKA